MSRATKANRTSAKRAGAILAAAAMVLVACGSDKGPTNYTINFPSVAAAVETDSVQLFVFDASGQDPKSICEQLVLKVKSSQDLGTRLVTGPAVTPCDLAAGAKPVTIPFGDRALLAVGTKGGATLLAGCTFETVGDGTLPVSISLGIVNTSVEVKSSTCSKLSDFCAGHCQ
jgi:hypothetical protein